MKGFTTALTFAFATAVAAPVFAQSTRTQNDSDTRTRSSEQRQRLDTTDIYFTPSTRDRADRSPESWYDHRSQIRNQVRDRDRDRLRDSQSRDFSREGDQRWYDEQDLRRDSRYTDRDWDWDRADDRFDLRDRNHSGEREQYRNGVYGDRNALRGSDVNEPYNPQAWWEQDRSRDFREGDRSLPGNRYGQWGDEPNYGRFGSENSRYNRERDRNWWEQDDDRYRDAYGFDHDENTWRDGRSDDFDGFNDSDDRAQNAWQDGRGGRSDRWSGDGDSWQHRNRYANPRSNRDWYNNDNDDRDGDEQRRERNGE